LGALRSLADTGVDLIAESIVTPALREIYLDTFQGTSVMFVGVRCPWPIAQARERARTDRVREAVDLDVPEFEAVHQHTYDLEVDTTSMSLHAGAKRVLDAFEASPQPTAFDAMREGTRWK
jgi:chloramphenicol 3-O-phosphotransferase